MTTPKQPDGFLLSIRRYLGYDLVRMARVMELGCLEYAGLERRSAAELADYDSHPMWELLEAEMTERLAGLLAARQRLSEKMEKDRKRRILRTARSRQVGT